MLNTKHLLNTTENMLSKIKIFFTNDTLKFYENSKEKMHQNTYFTKYNWLLGLYFVTFVVYILCNIQYVNINDFVWYTTQNKTYSWSFSNTSVWNISNLFLTLGCIYTLFLGRMKRDMNFKNFFYGLFFYTLTIAALLTLNSLLNVDLSNTLIWVDNQLIDSTVNSLQLLILLTVYAIMYIALTNTNFGLREENMIAVTFLIYFLLNILKTDNLVLIFISALGTTLSMAFMMLGEKTTASEAAYKYVIQSAVVGTFFMYGLSQLIVSSYGSVNLLDIGTLEESNIQLGVSLILLTILFKLSQFPNHQWAPEIYTGISNPVLGLFLVPMKIGFVGLIYKLVWTLNTNFSFTLLFWSATISTVLGAWGALRQNTISRFLGWTSISNMGLILLPLTWFTENAQQSLNISLGYLIVYTALLTVLWYVLNTTLNKDNETVLRISDLYKIQSGDLSRINITALFLILGGVPPFLGFALKVSVLHTYMENMLNYVEQISYNISDLSPLLAQTTVYLWIVYIFVVILFGLSITLWNYLGVVSVIFRRDFNNTQVSYKSILSNKTQYAILFSLILLTLYSTELLNVFKLILNSLFLIS